MSTFFARFLHTFGLIWKSICSHLQESVCNQFSTAAFCQKLLPKKIISQLVFLPRPFSICQFFVADSKHGFRCFVVLLMNLQLEQKCFCLLTMFAQRLVCSRNWRRNFATINELQIPLDQVFKRRREGFNFFNSLSDYCKTASFG